jgi:hypothetical protein
MEIAKHADICSVQNSGEPHGHRHAFDFLAAEIRRNADRLLISKMSCEPAYHLYDGGSAMLIRSFHVTALGHKRAFWPSVCVETFRKRTPFFEKIRKNAEPHRNRNGVHGNFKNNPALSLSPELPGQSFRKVSSLFQTRPPDYASFSTPASAGCQPGLVRSSRTTRSRRELPNLTHRPLSG